MLKFDEGSALNHIAWQRFSGFSQDSNEHFVGQLGPVLFGIKVSSENGYDLVGYQNGYSIFDYSTHIDDIAPIFECYLEQFSEIFPVEFRLKYGDSMNGIEEITGLDTISLIDEYKQDVVNVFRVALDTPIFWSAINWEIVCLPDEVQLTEQGYTQSVDSVPSYVGTNEHWMFFVEPLRDNKCTITITPYGALSDLLTMKIEDCDTSNLKNRIESACKEIAEHWHNEHLPQLREQSDKIARCLNIL